MTTAPSDAVTSNVFAESRVAKSTSEYKLMFEFLDKANCRGTFLFFGSARALSQDAYATAVASATAVVEDPKSSPEDKAKAAARLATLKSQDWVAPYWEKTRQLAHDLTVWAKSEEGVNVGNAVNTNFPAAQSQQPLVVCTGGGPGFMEAGNKGAADAKGASMGIGVTLPFETRLNDYVTPELGITCDQFFSRKYWEVFAAKAMIVCPGGVGTTDEMAEVLTLMQCQKMPKIPVVLLGKEFWTTAVNLRYLADKGMMTHREIDELCITDDPAEACEFIVDFLKREASENSPRRSQPPGPA
eukprot:CAMPEP_0174830422 /NCGR_PEP_ID=MMETSP1114-20130205/2503_1 /TAXON_ID=312471 /ORGANISM="Neobodo designis, Strain CCAP 1951/1" /LENGTH=299 /DNA_ID=CAMNT_0016064221 /DNA_START=71 /DNA_END=970 /DNA_ORIENTATION=+